MRDKMDRQALKQLRQQHQRVLELELTCIRRIDEFRLEMEHCPVGALASAELQQWRDTLELVRKARDQIEESLARHTQ